jgi:hypothetical protein
MNRPEQNERGDAENGQQAKERPDLAAPTLLYDAGVAPGGGKAGRGIGAAFQAFHRLTIQLLQAAVPFTPALVGPAAQDGVSLLIPEHSSGLAVALGQLLQVAAKTPARNVLRKGAATVRTDFIRLSIDFPI